MSASFRRHFLQGSTAAALGMLSPRAAAARAAVNVGYILPQTGPLSLFGISDAFVIDAVKDRLAALGITLLVRDSRSDPQRAAALATELIDNNISLMLVSSTPETTNPVSDQCELAGVPCLSTIAPWQSWFFNRGGNPDTGFVYTYHFFWGLEDLIGVYTAMWNQMATNKTIGSLFPSDFDGFAYADPLRGFPPALAAQSFKLISPGQFADMTPDFSAQIDAFKSSDAQIITGVMQPPDFVTFWQQAVKTALRPKIVSMSKALLFPELVEQLGAIGQNLSTEIWWSPRHPFVSSLTKQTALELATAYSAATGKQWAQPVGFSHALCELAADIIGRASDPTNPDKVLEALVNTNLQTMVGPIAWGNGPVKNVCKTPLVGGQWRYTAGEQHPYDLVIRETGQTTNIPRDGEMQPMT
jgi:branched-chain amino acid transport system substrate-binding protein